MPLKIKEDLFQYPEHEAAATYSTLSHPGFYREKMEDFLRQQAETTTDVEINQLQKLLIPFFNNISFLAFSLTNQERFTILLAITQIPTADREFILKQAEELSMGRPSMEIVQALCCTSISTECVIGPLRRPFISLYTPELSKTIYNQLKELTPNSNKLTILDEPKFNDISKKINTSQKEYTKQIDLRETRKEFAIRFMRELPNIEKQIVVNELKNNHNNQPSTHQLRI